MKNQPLIVGVAAAVIAIAAGAGLLFAVTAGDDNASGTSGPDAPSSRGTSSTTTTSTRVPVSTAAPPTTTDRPAVDPQDAYQPLPMPPGVTGAISSCIWSATAGGQLQASGTVTNLGNEDDFWLVSPVWLVRNGPQDEDVASETVLINDLIVGTSQPWSLTSGYPTPPPNLSCALEVE